MYQYSYYVSSAPLRQIHKRVIATPGSGCASGLGAHTNAAGEMDSLQTAGC